MAHLNDESATGRSTNHVDCRDRRLLGKPREQDAALPWCQDAACAGGGSCRGFVLKANVCTKRRDVGVQPPMPRG